MKILFCISSLSGGGAETQLYYLAYELSKKGHDVHVFYIIDISLDEKKKWEGVKLHLCNVNSNYSFKIIYQLITLLKKHRFDIIQTWVVQMDILVGVLSFLYNFKWVVRESSSDKNYNNSYKNKLRIFLSKKSSCIVSNSIAGSNYWSNQNSITDKIVINNGIPYDGIEANLFSDHFVNKFDDYILFVGRLIENGTAKKNILKLIHAFSNIIQKNFNYNLVIVGEGKDRLLLEESVLNLGLKNRVFFTGKIDRSKIFFLMKESKLFVSLSEYEGCPNTVLEAFFCCNNILLSNIPEHRHLFDKDDFLETFVDLNSFKEISDKILLKLSSSPTNYKILTTKFTISNMVNGYLNLYNKLISIN